MGDRRCGKTNHRSNYSGLSGFTNSGQEPTFLATHTWGCVFHGCLPPSPGEGGSWPLYVMSRRLAPACHTAVVSVMSEAAPAAAAVRCRLDRTSGVSTF